MISVRVKFSRKALTKGIKHHGIIDAAFTYVLTHPAWQAAVETPHFVCLRNNGRLVCRCTLTNIANRCFAVKKAFDKQNGLDEQPVNSARKSKHRADLQAFGRLSRLKTTAGRKSNRTAVK